MEFVHGDTLEDHIKREGAVPTGTLFRILDIANTSFFSYCLTKPQCKGITMKLYLVYLGGRAKNANIELHDVQFVAGESIAETFSVLRENWFGELSGLHLDSYVEIKLVDGFRVELKHEPFIGAQNLYFVNLGGYDPNSIAELHQFGLFVQESAEEAKWAAKQRLLLGAKSQHKDDLFDVDDCLAIDRIQSGAGDRLYVHLTPDDGAQLLKPDWFGYQVIG